MTDETPNPTAPDVPADAGFDAQPGARRPAAPDAPPPDAPPPVATDVRAHRLEYKGAELDPERGPGLGCFWFQLIVLGFFIVLIPIGLNLGWPYELLAILLFVVIGLLLLTGQSVIFLLRLVAADRRAQGRRRPLASPTKTVGELEDQHRVAHAVGGARPAGAGDATSTESPAEPPARPADAAATPPEGAGARTDAVPDPVADRASIIRAEPTPASPDEGVETLPAGIDGAAPESLARSTSVDGGAGPAPGPDPAGAAEPAAPPTPESSTDRRQAGSDPVVIGPDEADRTPDEADRTPDEPLPGAPDQSSEEPGPGVRQ